ncbi:E3 ubiquitin-protein ligase RHF2A isoform X1 [Ziziphus jujuba]|uniref:RING-type E3 ubiquitin transferase n=2 Tax=Ziziphus jujuba TaxID=326968 RepID=A0A6P6FLA5_ZIZJJ|nr:E3 ubiquitin-protein ligase RHF2A isoform X1 [Ziziphus jujuba]
MIYYNSGEEHKGKIEKVLEMEEANGAESHSTSAAAFVEGGVQDACDDACSICLEEFCEKEPSTMTNCRHEFHLQCILEWCQRSSQCPMCWQSISLKDPSSQELLKAVEQERSLRATPRNATIYNHSLGGFEVQRLPLGANNAELEETIMHHLASAAAMGRPHNIGRREGQRIRISARGRPHLYVYSAHPSALPSGSVSASGADTEPAAIAVASPSTPLRSSGDEPSEQTSQYHFVQTDRNSSLASGSNWRPNRRAISCINRSASHSSSLNEDDEAGPSDFHSFSESLKSKFNAMSMRYKESISKSTKGWKERLFSRTTSMSGIGSEVRREVTAGISSIWERFETRAVGRADQVSMGNNLADGSSTEGSNQNNGERRGRHSVTQRNIPTSCAASSASG